MKIYGSHYLSTVSLNGVTRRIPSAMGLYRVEGGCLYRIKIDRYRTPPRCTSNGSISSDRALGRLTLHEFRDDRSLPLPPTPGLHSLYNLPPLSSLSLFLSLSPCHILFRVLFSLNSGKHRAPWRRDNGQVVGREKETCTHEVSRRTGIREGR